MFRSKSFYCSCSICTQVRNEEPKHYRYLHSLREFFSCSSCIPRQEEILNESTSFHSPSTNRRLATITFRDIDITHKHCSKHEVLVKASRPHFTKNQNEEIRQRVREANQCWTRMSILPVYLIEFIFDQKDFLPLCSMCFENLSKLKFSLCHRCLRRILHYSDRIEPSFNSQSISMNPTDLLTSTDDATSPLDESQQIFFDCHQGESIS